MYKFPDLARRIYSPERGGNESLRFSESNTTGQPRIHPPAEICLALAAIPLLLRAVRLLDIDQTPAKAPGEAVRLEQVRGVFGLRPTLFQSAGCAGEGVVPRPWKIDDPLQIRRCMATGLA